MSTVNDIDVEFRDVSLSKALLAKYPPEFFHKLTFKGLKLDFGPSLISLYKNQSPPDGVAANSYFLTKAELYVQYTAALSAMVRGGNNCAVPAKKYQERLDLLSAG